VLHHPSTMLIKAARQIRRHANVQGAPILAGENVNYRIAQHPVTIAAAL